MAVFVRYILNNNYKEELLTLLPLHDRTTGQILFQHFKEFMNNNNLSYQKILSVVTDGAPAMTGKANGFVALLKQNNSKIISLHCIIHQAVLCAKLSDDFKDDHEYSYENYQLFEISFSITTSLTPSFS